MKCADSWCPATGLLVVGAIVGAELGWYVVGRVASPLTAVSIRTNPEPGLPAPAFDGTLTIITYNICHGWGGDANKFERNRTAITGRLDAVTAMLAEEKPDIAVLQEIDFDSMLTGRINEAHYIADKAGYPYWVEQKNVDAKTLMAFSERTGNAVLSRYPICKARLVSFPGHKTWETILGGKSMAALCDIKLTESTKIRVLATHLASFSEQVRVASAKIIEKYRRASELPFLVVGDLNSAPPGIPNHRLHEGENAMDFLLAGGAYATLPLSNPAIEDLTIRVGRPSAIVDWILVPKEWRILGRHTLPLAVSDHYPVRMAVNTRLGAAHSGQ